MENAGFNKRSNWDRGWVNGAALKYWLTYGSCMARACKTYLGRPEDAELPQVWSSHPSVTTQICKHTSVH